MNAFKKLALAVIAASFCASAPALAVDIPGKPDPAAALKSKAGEVIEQGKAKLGKDLGLQQNAPEQKNEEVNVTQETVTVETPQGTASETTVTVSPESPVDGAAAPSTPADGASPAAPADGSSPAAPETPAK